MIDTALQNRQPLSPGAFTPLPLGALRLTGPGGQAADKILTVLLRAIEAETGLFSPQSVYLGGEVYAPDMSGQLLALAVAAGYSGNETLQSQLRRFANHLMDTAQPGGAFGPSQADLYDHALCCRALAHYYTACGQRRILAVMAQYFQYLSLNLEQLPLSKRDPLLLCELLEPMLWLYNLVGYPFLRRLSAQISRLSPNWTGHFTAFGYTRDLKQAMPDAQRDREGRTYPLTDGAYNAAALKYPALLHVFLGGNQNAAAPKAGLTRMLQAHGQPQGLYACDDHFSGLSPCAAVSTQAAALALDSLTVLSVLSGDGFFADQAEQIAFNALPGAFSSDYSQMQRYGCANQVSAVPTERFYNAAPDGLLFGPAPVGALGALLSFPRLMAMKQERGLALLSYPDAKLTWMVRGTPVRVTVTGGYPRCGRIAIAVRVKNPVSFTLSLRVPGWAQGAVLTVDGQDRPLQAGSFAQVDRRWQESTVLTLTLPMELRAQRGFRQSVTLQRGPLLMALPLAERWEPLEDGRYALSTDAPWAFALSPQALTTASDDTVTAAPVPWAQMDGGRSAGAPPVQPQASGPLRELALVPFSQTRLRVSRFPVLDGPES